MFPLFHQCLLFVYEIYTHFEKTYQGRYVKNPMSLLNLEYDVGKQDVIIGIIFERIVSFDLFMYVT